MQDPSETNTEYYKQIAEHYVSVKDHKHAEEYYIKAGMSQEVVEMYTKADKWEEAYRIAVGCMPKAEVRQLYVSRATILYILQACCHP